MAITLNAQRDPRIRFSRQQKMSEPRLISMCWPGRTDSPYFKWAAQDVLLAAGFLAACVDVLDSTVSPISGR
jgi:hypothetical protein